MILHPDVSTWAIYTKQKASASVARPTGPYNTSYLKGAYRKTEPPPINAPQTLRYVTDKFGYPMANALVEGLNKYTPYNANYLKYEAGTYKQDPKLTPWTREGALKELKRPQKRNNPKPRNPKPFKTS